MWSEWFFSSRRLAKVMTSSNQNNRRLTRALSIFAFLPIFLHYWSNVISDTPTCDLIVFASDKTWVYILNENNAEFVPRSLIVDFSRQTRRCSSTTNGSRATTSAGPSTRCLASFPLAGRWPKHLRASSTSWTTSRRQPSGTTQERWDSSLALWFIFWLEVKKTYLRIVSKCILYQCYI